MFYTKYNFFLGNNKDQNLFLNVLKILSFYYIRNETATPLDISVVNISFLLTYIKLYYKVHDIPRRVKIIWRKRQWRKYWTFLNRFFKNFLMFSTDLVKQRRANHWQYLKSAREQPTKSEKRTSIFLSRNFLSMYLKVTVLRKTEILWYLVVSSCSKTAKIICRGLPSIKREGGIWKKIKS